MQPSLSSPYLLALIPFIISVTLFSNASIYVPRLDLGSNTNGKLVDKSWGTRSFLRMCRSLGIAWFLETTRHLHVNREGQTDRTVIAPVTQKGSCRISVRRNVNSGLGKLALVLELHMSARWRHESHQEFISSIHNSIREWSRRQWSVLRCRT
jgi:hypothetical protein